MVGALAENKIRWLETYVHEARLQQKTIKTREASRVESINRRQLHKMTRRKRQNTSDTDAQKNAMESSEIEEETQEEPAAILTATKQKPEKVPPIILNNPNTTDETRFAVYNQIKTMTKHVTMRITNTQLTVFPHGIKEHQ